MVKGITSGTLLNYVNYASGPTQSAEEMFAKFSVSLGGNGQTLSKDAVDSFISKAKNGSFNVSDDKMKFLNTLSKNWESLFGDKKEITSDDFNRAAGTFASIIASGNDDATVSETNSSENAEKEKLVEEKQKAFVDDLSARAKENTTKIINEYLTDLSERLDASLNGLSKNDLTKYLKSLLKTTDDSDTSAEIGLVSSLISDFENISGGSGYLKSLKYEAQYDETDTSSVTSADFEIPVRIRA